MGKSLADIAAEGDAQADEWFARGAQDDEKEEMRGAQAYPTLAKLAEGLKVRCWSHYFHWYCDRSSWRGGRIDRNVRELTDGSSGIWGQWLAWPGHFCQPALHDHFDLSFGYVLGQTLVSVAQIQASPEDFAWEFGVDTLPQFRRRGFATEVAKAATRWILNQDRIPWYYHDHYNRPSARVPVKLGYFLYAEGLFCHMRAEQDGCPEQTSVASLPGSSAQEPGKLRLPGALDRLQKE